MLGVCERGASLGVANLGRLGMTESLSLSVGSMLEDQGKYEQAEEMHRQKLGLCETVLGKEHPHTLTSMNNRNTYGTV